MKNVIELNLDLPTNTIHGFDGWMYLGKASVDGYMTGAIREFNLPHAVAPSEWPNPHEGVTTNEDPRHRG